MNTSFVLTLFGTLISVLLAVAGGIGTWAALRVGRNAQVINNFRTTAESWQAVAESQQTELDEVKTENAALRKQLAEVQGKVTVLTDLVRSALTSMAASTPKEVIDKIDALVSSLERQQHERRR